MKQRDYIAVILYFLLMDYVWINYCSTIWHAFFYIPSKLSISFRIIAYCFFATPILLRTKDMRATSLITLLVFLLGFSPIIVSLVNNYGGRDNLVMVKHGLVLTLIMSLSFITEAQSKRKRFLVQRKISVKFVMVSALIVLLIQIVYFRNNIRLVSLTDVYALREQNSSGVPTFLKYIFSWSDTVLYPFLFIVGYLNRRWSILILGVTAMLFQYLIFGSKISLFLPVLLLSISSVLKQKKYRDSIVIYFVLFVAVISSILLLTYKSSDISYLMSAIFLMRGMTISGVLYSGYYLPFFSRFEYTYFSHINVINKLTGLYPYGDMPLGKVVSYDGMNANAIFFAMDGLSGAGILGVLFVGLLYCLYIKIVNQFVPADKIRIFQLWMVVPVMALLNTSFFTFLLSEGAALIFILILYVRIEENSDFWRNVAL